MILFIDRVIAALRQAKRPATQFPRRPASYPRRDLCPRDTRGYRYDVAVPDHLRH